VNTAVAFHCDLNWHSAFPCWRDAVVAPSWSLW
jgi:hypothetical protein